MSTTESVFTLGLTGGMGSGKSEVSRLFSALGVPIIDADRTTHHILADPCVLRTLYARFGKQMVSNQILNRSLLKEIIFRNSDERRWLESLLHPLIMQAMYAERERVTGIYCIFVIPLLHATSPWRSSLDRILVVEAPLALRIERIKVRDQLAEWMMQAMLNAQAPSCERLSIADDIIPNDKSLAFLLPSVSLLHEQYKQWSKMTK